MQKKLAHCLAATGMVFGLFSASQVRASNLSYDLKMELTLDGKSSSPRIIVTEGQKASIEEVTTSKHAFVEVIATSSKSDSKVVMMDFVVGTVDSAGTRTIVSNPRILAKENERAQITIQNDEGSGNLSLAVVAQRRVL